MDDEVERLLLAPFREIVEKGRTAVENAQAADGEAPGSMAKAAQSLVKEGERALKRIEPLCMQTYGEYRMGFINFLKENDEIAHYRSELEDLLWDFDDFVEVDAFDGDKFDELQKASRKAAPKVVDIIKRLKLNAPVPPVMLSPPSSRTASTVADEAMRHAHLEGPPPRTSGGADPLSPTSTQKLMEETELQLNRMGTAAAGSPDSGCLEEEGWGGMHGPHGGHNRPQSRARQSSRASQTPSDPLPPPRPPTADPWQVGRTPPLSPDSHSAAADAPDWERRSPPPVLLPSDSPTIPHAQPTAAGPQSDEQLAGPPLRLRRLDDWASRAPGAREGYVQRPRSVSHGQGAGSEGSLSPVNSNRWTKSTQASVGSMGSMDSTRSRAVYGNPGHHHPENNSLSVPAPFPPRQSSYPGQQPPQYGGGPSRHPSTESVNSSVFDVVECVNNPSSPATTVGTVGGGDKNWPQQQQPMTGSSSCTGTTTTARSQFRPSPRTAQPPPYHHARNSNSSSSNKSSGHHHHQHVVVPAAPFRGVPLPPLPAPPPLPPTTTSKRPLRGGIVDDDGLIPVVTTVSVPDDPGTPTTPASARQAACGIGPYSSFYKLKGYCKGAEEARRGQLGFKRTTRPVGTYSSTTVARCNHCLFELDFRSIDLDINNDPSGNFTSNGVGFRLRILQKSHLPIRYVEEQLYGCPFCVQLGRTVDESDATVFFNQRQLFAHLSRHPRPLPEVAGLTVVQEPEVHPALANNYDLHFASPPAPPAMMGEGGCSSFFRDVANFPSAVATDTRKLGLGGSTGARSPPDRTPVLHFAVGARVVGIEFPDRYEGRWAVGWHDGARAALEADAVRFEAPPRGEVRMQKGGEGGDTNVQAVARWRWHQKGDDRWLRFDKGDVIKNIAWTYAGHWCWSGTTSKGWGLFPQSHLDPKSVRTVDPAASEPSKVSLRFSRRKKTDH
ncbi:hypothetical protein GGR56DRAFT_191696 [Xylariaceae sp. FL0804]|nr:hypothetical protein GGR56DRAFT_191696 [Xylariaceae sp. FL0804]